MITFPKSVMVSRLDEELVLMDTKGGHYFSLNESATEMLDLLMKGTSIENLSKLIASKYLVSIDQVIEDLNKLISELQSKELLIVAS